MPTVSISPVRGEVRSFTVEDKAEAIREISSRLLTIATRSSVEKALNMWLKDGMKNPIRLGSGDNQFILNYRN